MTTLYGDVHSSQGKPSDRPRVKAVLIHKEGTLFVNPLRRGGKRRPADGFLQELLLTEGLPAVRAIGQQWFEGFVDKGA
jgi:hypothetical protein